MSTPLAAQATGPHGVAVGEHIDTAIAPPGITVPWRGVSGLCGATVP
jgi:hypothetical protein